MKIKRQYFVFAKWYGNDVEDGWLRTTVTVPLFQRLDLEFIETKIKSLNPEKNMTNVIISNYKFTKLVCRK